jgi:hypothetical protein
MQRYFKDGFDFEWRVFDYPDEIILDASKFFKPRNFGEDIGRIIKSISRSKSHRKFPKTPIARNLYFGVVKQLKELGIKTSSLRLFSFLRTDVDRYYGTDALFYLSPSCGCECVVTIDAYLINPIDLTSLRDYWIESSEEPVYSELMFQRDLFAHKRIFSEHAGFHGPEYLWKRWILSKEYKELWERDYIPAIPDEMVDRPMMRPENHLLLAPYHLEKKWRREAFIKLVANEFYKQIFPKNKSAGEKSLLII